MIDRYSYPKMKALWTEESKLDVWLRIEILAAEAWAKLGRVPEEAVSEIRNRAGFDLARVREIEETVNHDVIAFLTAVAERVGESSKYIHLGMTSSDVVDTAFAFLMKQAANELIEDVDTLIEAVREKAAEHKYTPMIGRTHGVHAEPMTFGLKLLVWLGELERARDRLVRAGEVIGVGKISGAVGTYANVPPEIEAYVCAQLGLVPAKASSQILQRDRHAEYLAEIAVVGGSLEKFATEVRALQRTEVAEAAEPFGKGQKGSSAMPHKRNPILCERIAGLARILRGNAQAGMENISLWHERDISHSSVERVIVPDSTILLDYMLRKFTWVVQNMSVNRERMAANLEMTRGLIFSGSVLLALVDAGLLREKAYEIVQGAAMKAWAEGLDFRELIRNHPDVVARVDPDILDRCFDPRSALAHIDAVFARFGL
ncbi:MAG: adenylosuccinate lyase [Firmicutes bacterium]|jgi:adenylosuccinate lyase|nr:adenylosuccinate lyase [Bacillota bacterium]